MESKPSVLLVEDDHRLRQLLERFLQEHGFAVTAVADIKRMKAQRSRYHFDALILDIMLPDGDGLLLCQQLRGQGESIPIIMLTARGDDVDRILGLEIGADDYLAKPCNPRELVARLRALLRRTQTPLAGAPSGDDQQVYFGPWRLDLGRRLLSRDGEEHPLTTGEFAVLSTLARHPREPLSRDRLMALTKGRECEAYDRSIDVAISRLRRLIEDDPQKPRYIQTVRGVGYTLITDDPGNKGDDEKSGGDNGSTAAG